MTAQHTPGPWEQSIKGYDSDFFVEGEWEIAICGSDKHDGELPPMIASVTNLSLVDEEAEANARLIAAAPIMFRALDALLAAADTSLDYRPEFRLAVANANAAMALATGRNMPLPYEHTDSEGGEL